MMGRKFTPAERTALAARILVLSAEDPPLTVAVIAQRCGCGPNLVARVRREARDRETGSPECRRPTIGGRHG
jgi:hypothetical protein